MKKTFLLSLIMCAFYHLTTAQQCTIVYSRYLNASGITDSGFVFAFNLPNLPCDSIFYMFLGVCPVGANNDSCIYAEVDGLKQLQESVWQFTLKAPLALGREYFWYINISTDHFGGTTHGKNFVVQDPVATGNCMPPAGLCLYSPGDTSAHFVWTGTAGPWNQPTKYTLSTKASGGVWVPYTKKIANEVTITGLTPSTNYKWKLRYKCSTQNSVFIIGPSFTTAATTPFAETGISAPVIMPMRYLTAKNTTHAIAKKMAPPVNTAILQLYPNPVTSQLHVQLTPEENTKSIDTYSIILKDMTGRIFYRATNINAYALRNMAIDVSRIPTGLYMMQVIGSDNSIVTSKVNISR